MPDWSLPTILVRDELPEPDDRHGYGSLCLVKKPEGNMTYKLVLEWQFVQEASIRDAAYSGCSYGWADNIPRQPAEQRMNPHGELFIAVPVWKAVFGNSGEDVVHRVGEQIVSYVDWKVNND